MDFASGKRLSFHFQIHFRINICSVERDVQAPEFTVRIRGLPSRAVWRLQRFVRRPCALGAVGRYAWPSPTLRIQRIRIPEPASQPLRTAVPPGRAGPAR